MGKGFDKFTAEINSEVEKVKEERKKQYYRQMMDLLIQHIKDVMDDEYDELMAQAHKSFVRAWKFITGNAQKMAVNNCAFVADSTVYGWFDEYLGIDDKAEVEKELKAEKESKERAAAVTKKAKESHSKATQETLDLGLDDEVAEKKPTESSEQLSIFDLM